MDPMPTDPSHSTAFWTVAPGRGELRREPLAAPRPDEALVTALYSGVSRGTESLVFHGRVPESQWQSMRAPLQVGDFHCPVKYGYASVGRVDQGPPDLAGRSVFCLHPHQDRYVAPAAMLVPLPDGLPPARAVLGANMETAVNGLWDAGPRVGDRIVVLGAGVVGALTAWLGARIPGTRVTLCDIDPARAGLAAALGLDFAAPAEAPADADLVVEASGAPEALATALGLTGYEATVLCLSWYGDAVVPLPLGEAFHSRRLRLVSSQVGGVSPARRARRTHAQRMATALELLTDPALEALITGESRFSEMPDVMPRLTAPGSGVLCHRIVYD
ncbi:Threonine dehydrogenase [Caenispirillum salinarum AK4]|uniref:Threonine dehydrogenase n=1 Tax=Caenispirillum salinarum AK4 TaxID=1238182 RepID=K9HDJ8_9PROT|nr:Threonine dehydrogenase [Caenispirillum salinarum AK4]